MAGNSVFKKIQWILQNEGIRFFLQKKYRLFLLQLQGEVPFDASEKTAKAEHLERLLKKKRYATTLTEGLFLLKTYPTYFPFLRAVGQAYLELEKYDQAQSFFERAALYDTRPGRAKSSLAVLSWLRGEKQKAEEIFEQALQCKDSCAQTLSQWIFLERQEPSEALIPLLRRALAYEPTALRYSIDWILCLKQFLGSTGYPEIQEYLTQYVEMFPDDVKARSLQLEFRIRNEGDIVLEQVVADLHTKKPEQEQCVVVAKAIKALLGEGKEYLSDSYLQVLKILLTYYPNVACAYFDLGQIVKASEASSEFRAFTKSPAKVQALDFFLAGTAIGTGREKRRAQVSAFEMLLKMREHSTLEKNLEKALQEYGQSLPKGLAAVAAQYYLSKRQPESSLEYRLQGLAEEGRTVDHLLAIGRSYAAKGKVSQAYSLFLEAAAIREGEPSIERVLTECELELGMVMRAKERFDRLQANGVAEAWMEAFGETLESYVSNQPDRSPCSKKFLCYTLSDAGELTIYDEQGDASSARDVLEQACEQYDWIILRKRGIAIDKNLLAEHIEQRTAATGYLYCGEKNPAYLAGQEHNLPSVMAFRTADMRLFLSTASSQAVARLLLRLKGSYAPEVTITHTHTLTDAKSMGGLHAVS